jgi:hypothetical protein
LTRHFKGGRAVIIIQIILRGFSSCFTAPPALWSEDSPWSKCPFLVSKLRSSSNAVLVTILPGVFMELKLLIPNFT